MRTIRLLTPAVALWGTVGAASAVLAQTCEGYGPQSPRDIRETAGANPQSLALVPSPSELNLCSIHFHESAEHRGPGFSVSVASADGGGFQCDQTGSLTEAELADPTGGEGFLHGSEVLASAGDVERPPMCAKVSLSSLQKWCEGNVFSETEAYGVRELVTAQELLSQLE